LYNSRLKKVRKDSDEWREKCRRGGKKSAETRRNNANSGKGSSRVVQLEGQVNGNTPTPPPTPPPKKNIYIFTPPTIEEIEEYAPDLDAVAFWNFYESKGWMVGKNKMKKWKSAIVTWRRNNTKPKTQGKKLW
jgi:hypothetical protein